MPLFNYTVISYTGKKINGQIEARDRSTAISTLRKSQLIIVDIRELKGEGLKQKSRVKLEDLIIFTRQLGALVKAGVPLVKGLNILFGQVENRALRQIISSVITKIESGSSLSDALAYYPNMFSHLYINMIKAGEFSGALDAILERLSTYLESNERLARKVRAAFIYPSVILTVAILITAIIFLKVIPGFESIFTSLGASLPLPTQIVFSISQFSRKYFVVAAGGMVGLFFLIRQILQLPAAGIAFDRLKLDFPVFGRVIRKVVVARFSRTLSTLLKSGVSILVALEISSKTSGNRIVEIALDKVTSRVSKGEKIAESLMESKLFAPLVVSLVAVGEETGDISSMLDKIAYFYEDEVDVAVGNLTSLIEPFIIVFLGVLIGGIVLSIFLPILQLTQVMGR